MSKYQDFDRRKSIHIKLFADTHAKFRIELMKKKLSMQEVIEAFAQRVVAEDGFALRMLDTIARKKRDKEIERLSSTDVESLFDVIEDNQRIDD